MQRHHDTGIWGLGHAVGACRAGGQTAVLPPRGSLFPPTTTTTPAPFAQAEQRLLGGTDTTWIGLDWCMGRKRMHGVGMWACVRGPHSDNPRTAVCSPLYWLTCGPLFSHPATVPCRQGSTQPLTCLMRASTPCSAVTGDGT